MFRLIEGLNIDSEEVVGGRCMRGGDGNICFSENGRANVWKDYKGRV